MKLIQDICKLIAIPILIFLYITAIIPLTVRQLAHRLTWCFDYAFDLVATSVGFDTRFWPFPRASDNRLPWEERL